jgi:hypothetical protein
MGYERKRKNILQASKRKFLRNMDGHEKIEHKQNDEV